MFPFTLRQIEIFQMLCECGSFSSTAEKLRISQPTVSQQIGTLERQLGFELFARCRGGRAILTPAGRNFHESACEFIAAGKRLAEHRRKELGKKPKLLNVYIGSHILEDFVRPNMWKLYEICDGIELNFVSGIPRIYSAEEFLERNIDVGVFIASDWNLNKLVPGIEKLGQVSSGIYGHKKYLDITLDHSAVSRLPFMMDPRKSREEIKTLAYLARNKVYPDNIVVRSAYHDVHRQMLKSGVAVCFGLESVFYTLFPDVVCLFPTDPWTKVFFRSDTVSDHLADSLKAFIRDCMKDACRD